MRRAETFLLQLFYAVNKSDNCQLPQIAKLGVVEITDAYHDLYNHRVVQAQKRSQEVIQSDLLLKAGSAIRSGQVAQVFIQSGLENLLETA